MKVLVIDPQPIVAAGISALLGVNATVVSATTLEDACRLLPHHRPKVVVTELRVDGGIRTDLPEHILRREPDARILVFSAVLNGNVIREGFERGVLGFIAKTAHTDDLKSAIDTVATGNRYVEARLMELILPPRGGRIPPIERLTAREFQVFRLLADGMTVKEIAAQLTLSPRTVRIHRSNIMEKLGAGNITQLIKIAVEQGIVTLRKV